MNNKAKQKSDMIGSRKIITVSFILLLASGIFVESVMSGVCFCERCCPDFSRKITGIKINSNFHKDSIGSNYKNCRLKRGNSLKAIHFCKQNLNTKIVHALINFCFSGFSPPDMYSRHITAEEMGGFQKRPIYLQYLSFRC
jgi:hypothetical protein